MTVKPTGTDLDRLGEAIRLATLCPPSSSAFSVGAIIVDGSGREISRGFSREGDPHAHAEEAALAKVSAGERRLLGDATIYSSLEPCAERRSRPRACADLIVDAGLRRCVFAWREPVLFVDRPSGAGRLQRAGVVVIEVEEMASLAKAVNAHLFR